MTATATASIVVTIWAISTIVALLFSLTLKRDLGAAGKTEVLASANSLASRSRLASSARASTALRWPML